MAAQEYEKAVAAAPWVPGYYADLCTIYEKAGKFEAAKRHCGFYVSSPTDPAETTNVKRRIAGLESGALARRGGPNWEDVYRISRSQVVREQKMDGRLEPSITCKRRQRKSK